MWKLLQRIIDFFTKTADSDVDQIQEDPFVLPAPKPSNQADAATLRLIHCCDSNQGSVKAVILAGSEH